MKKIKDIVQIIGVFSIVPIPVTFLFAIWLDFNEVTMKVAATSIVIFFTCLFIDKSIEIEE